MRSVFATAGLALLLGGACGGGTGNGSAAIMVLTARMDAVVALLFAATTTIPSNPAPPVNVTVTDSGAARSVYAATLALPVVPPGTYNCPIDFGVSYRLTFRDAGGATVMTASEDPGGCQGVTVVADGTSAVLWSEPEPGYWNELAAGLGVPVSAIYPYAPPP